MRLAQIEYRTERSLRAAMLDCLGNITTVLSLRLQEAILRLLERRLEAVVAPLRRGIMPTEWKWCAVNLFSVLLWWGLMAFYAWAAALGGHLHAGRRVHGFSVRAASRWRDRVACIQPANLRPHSSAFSPTSPVPSQSGRPRSHATSSTVSWLPRRGSTLICVRCRTAIRHFWGAGPRTRHTAKAAGSSACRCGCKPESASRWWGPAGRAKARCCGCWPGSTLRVKWPPRV